MDWNTAEQSRGIRFQQTTLVSDNPTSYAFGDQKPHVAFGCCQVRGFLQPLSPT